MAGQLSGVLGFLSPGALVQPGLFLMFAQHTGSMRQSVSLDPEASVRAIRDAKAKANMFRDVQSFKRCM